MSTPNDTSLECPDLRTSREALAAIVMAYCAAIFAALDRWDGRKTWRLCSKLNTTLRRHLKIQHKLYEHAMRERLAETQTMRLQVRRGLGGKPAMVKWEMRRRHGRKSGSTDESSSSPNMPAAVLNRIERETHHVRKTPQTPWTPKTDRFGNFRLATIPDGPTSRRSPRPIKTRKITYDMGLKFHPIEVSASDLLTNRNCSSEYWLPPLPSASPDGLSPPIERWPI